MLRLFRKQTLKDDDVISGVMKIDRIFIIRLGLSGLNIRMSDLGLNIERLVLDVDRLHKLKNGKILLDEMKKLAKILIVKSSLILIIAIMRLMLILVLVVFILVKSLKNVMKNEDI